MNTMNHLYIGRILYRYFRKKYDYKIIRSEFMLGNIVPDFYPNVVLKPHYITNYEAAIKKELAFLCNNYSLERHPYYFLRLGRVCHYISDFFCHAHNINFNGNSRQHFGYEHKLSKHCRRNNKKLSIIDYMPVRDEKTDLEGFFPKILDMHKYFLENEAELSSDLFYAIYACVMVIEWLF